MSDQPIDNAATPSVASTTVAPPPGGEAPATTPATSAETAVPGEPSEGQPQAEPKRDRKVEKRISRLTQRAEAAQREAGYWRGIAEARASQAQPEPTEGTPSPSRATPEDTAANRAAAESMKAALDRVRDDGKDIEDFDEVMEALFELPSLSRTTIDYLGTADHPAQLAQWLTDNPKEAARIAQLDSAVAVRALEKQDAKLAKPPGKKTTQAPPPVPTVGGRSTAEFDPEKASMEEYAAHWKARQAKG